MTDTDTRPAAYEECADCKGSMRLVGHTDHYSDGFIPADAQGAIPDPPTPDVEATDESTKSKPRAKTPDTSKITPDAINGATLAAPDLVSAAQPMRERSPEQKVMDGVAVKAYAEWVKADRPSAWGKVPVVTYFVTAEEAPAYRYLIRRACAIVPPDGNSIGVRVRFGNEFTLSEQMAEKIGRPDDAGKTVLAWAAVDKRSSDERHTNPPVEGTKEGDSQVQAKAEQAGRGKKK